MHYFWCNIEPHSLFLIHPAGTHAPLGGAVRHFQKSVVWHAKQLAAPQVPTVQVPMGRIESAMPNTPLMRSVSLPTVAANGVHWLPVPGWDRYSWLRAGFSTRKGGHSRAYCASGEPGELNLGFTVDDARDTVLANRRLLVEAVTGNPDLPLVALKQIHSSLVLHSTAADAARPLPSEADGHFTAEPGLLLAVQTADCIPVLVADTKKKIVAGFHAGWRGTVQRIVELGVARLQAECGSQPQDLIAAIGPGVGACCYAVGGEVIPQFTAQFAYAAELFHQLPASSAEPAIHLDLIEANRRQLLTAGLAPSAILIVGGCTNCHQDLFFSHRGSSGHAGRMMAVIGVVAG
jgi:hypothetical protein